MHSFKIDFDSLDWQPLRPGARAKVHCEGARQVRLVEFTSEFVEPQWCEKGHIGYVVSGSLEIDFRGTLIAYPAGSGIFIPPGSSSAHKARSVTPVVRVVLVEDA
jgi:quercetin dioxygenase-like cupin family protein